jgi:hypothetical protein
MRILDQSDQGFFEEIEIGSSLLPADVEIVQASGAQLAAFETVEEQPLAGKKHVAPGPVAPIQVTGSPATGRETVQAHRNKRR